MEKYMDYLRCGEIYKSPSQSDKTPYILKCFRCSDVFLLLESFIFHIEDYCKQEEASTSTAVATIKSEPSDMERQFNIEMVEENYRGHDTVEYKEDKYNIQEMLEEEDDVMFEENEEVEEEEEEEEVCDLLKPTSIEIKNESYGIESDVDCELIEDSPIEIKNEPIADNDDVCVDAVDIYVSDVFDDDIDDNNPTRLELSCVAEVEQYGLQIESEDTESADEDPIAPKIAALPKDSSPRILKFMESPTNVLTFITTYKSQPKLWNKKIYPYSEEQYKSCLDTLTKELNDQLKLFMPSNIVAEMITYLHRTYKEDLKNLRNNSDGKKYKPLWYFEYLRFLKPYVESNVFANLDKSLPPMIPEQIVEIINIYKTFPHLWDCTYAEYCCQNKRSESEVLMLRTIKFRTKLEFTQSMLQKFLRCIHIYFVREKYKRNIENNIEEISDLTTTADEEPNYYSHLQFLYEHVGPFKCSECEQLLKSPFLMKTHVSKHNGSTPLTCSVCAKGFKTIGPYVSHARRHMEDFHEECKTCGKKFLTSAELEGHMTYHVKRYKCDTCPSTFMNILSLTNHKKFHTKRPLYKCRHCGKVSSNKATLESHVQIHRTAHVCKTCGKKFTNPKALLVHETLHTEFKKYDCRKCPKVFKTKLSLDQHMRTHIMKTNI